MTCNNIEIHTNRKSEREREIEREGRGELDMEHELVVMERR